MVKGTDISHAATLLRNGGVVAFPTETVYGLGANGFNPTAVARIFGIKKRPSFDPLILHISSLDYLNEILEKPVDERVYRLAMAFWPGPLTIVAPKSKLVPELVSSGLPTVAVRMPNHEVALRLLSEARVPVAAPSANLFGRLSPTTADHVENQLSDVDYIFDGGKTHFGVESTIVSVSLQGVTLLRPGAISLEQLRLVVPEIQLRHKIKSIDILAPGQMSSHYAPEKPLFLVNSIPENLPRKSGIILMKERADRFPFDATPIFLSKTGDLYESASNLFSALHLMESDENVETIFAETVEETGIGMAIMDRLRKAAFKYQS